MSERNPGLSRIRRALPIWTCLMPLALFAQEPSPQELQKMARNPFANIIKVTVTPDLYFDAGPHHRTGSDLQFQGLIPVQISERWLLVARVVSTPAYFLPNVTRETGGSFGAGDTFATCFFTPAKVGRLTAGVGPAVLMPTATQSILGSGRWGLGPAVAAQIQPEWGSALILVQNVWSLPGATLRDPVEQMQVLLSFSYNLPHAWYLMTSPTVAADWRQLTRERWLVPLGGGAGRTFKLGRQPLDANLALYRNVVRPSGQGSPTWQLSLQMTLLFAKRR